MARTDSEPVPPRPSHCTGGCAHCAMLRPRPNPEPAAEHLEGRSFALASMGYFLVPLALTCVGATLGAAAGHVEQSMGAACGLALGMGVCALKAGRRGASEEAAWERR